MAKPRKTTRNPHQLTTKQRLAIADMIQDVADGKGINPTKSHLKIYQTDKKRNASVLASENLDRPNFQQALIDGLTKRRILGKNSKVEQRLDQGLDAVTKRPVIVDRDSKGKPVYEYVNETDYRVRLAYIQEINKVAGLYAPEKKQTSKLNINLDLTPQKLRERIQELEGELSE